MKFWLLYALTVFLLAAAFFRSAKIMPVCEVVAGQTLYTVEAATSQAITTGYKISVPTKSGNVSPPPSASPLATAGALTSAAQERPANKSRPQTAQGASSADSRTVEQKSPRPTSPGEELLNPYIIEQIIKSSDKTYYFTEKSLARAGVTLELLTATPRKDDYFLKFRIVNSAREHFIPQAFAIKHGDDWVDIQKFFPKYLVDAGAEVVGYLQVKTPYGHKERLFQLNESGGSFRKYSIFY